MSSDQPSKQRSSNTAITAFIHNANKLPQRQSDGGIARLIFAMDATASRQPSWDRACQLQNQMFQATAKLGGLQLQLCYYCGINQFHFSPWLQDSHALGETMSAVQCLGGYTQLERVLDHSLSENAAKPLQAVIIIGDAVEESVDKLCAKAGKLGLLGVPLFMFLEGSDIAAKQCFQQMALLSKGTYASFDENSAAELAELLAAVATYASGGFSALLNLHSNAAKHLLEQLKG
jgi:hypothetical protein